MKRGYYAIELEFKPVVAGDIDRLRPFYGLRPNETCDSVSLDSFLWKGCYHVQCAAGEGRAVLWPMEKDGQVSTAMPLCREEDLPYFFQQMVDYFSGVLHKPFYISLADEEVVQCLNLDPTFFEVGEQVDLKDYLYSSEELRKLERKKFVKKRNHLNGLKRIYEGRYGYRCLCCSDRHEVWQFVERWRQHKEEVGAMGPSLDYEVAGIYDILRNCSGLYVRMVGVYIDGQLEAFTIGSLNVRKNTVVIHIEKTDPEIRGLYQLINQQFLINEFPEAELVNREDDTGMEGLRKAKTDYCPIGFAREYMVRER